ncbi:MAG TPA: M20/M25/M40 family metallo-hydrolase [Chloroflexota bacterium]|jgi:acetylornithine deacetylase/succinyl-diaminopimelate desuccinylase-like protein
MTAIDWNRTVDEATEILSRYVRLDSSHPRGRTVETAALFADQLSVNGIPYRVYESPEEGKVNLVARLTAAQPTGKPLLLSNHMDVVQAVAADWRFDPYSGEVADGYVYGRGALDMKGMGVMELMTMLLLKRRNAELTRDVILLCNCDEEIGSPMGARWMVENHFDDLDPEFVLDEGGSGMRGFFSVGDAFEISVAEKRAVRLRLVARAEPGHASQPWPEAATHRLVTAAHNILTQLPEDRECPPVAEMIKRLGGDVARREIAAKRASMPLLHDTVSLTMLSGGYKINVIPERAEMSFDCRLLPDTDARAFVSNLEQVVNDAGVTFEVTWPDAAPATAPWDNPLFKALESACKTHAPNAIVTPSICVGGTDARYFRQRGVPAYGLVPCLFDAEDLKGYHGIDERLSIENLRLGTMIIYDTVLTCVT